MMPRSGGRSALMSNYPGLSGSIYKLLTCLVISGPCFGTSGFQMENDCFNFQGYRFQSPRP